MTKKLVFLGLMMICFISKLNAQQQTLPDDEFAFVYSLFGNNTVSQEIIPCDAAYYSNTNALVSIHRTDGIPRFGLVVDCYGNELDTVWYMNPYTNKIIRNTGYYCPVMTDVSINVWNEGGFRIQIMDVLTGDVVFSESHQGQGISSFSRKSINDNLYIDVDLQSPNSDVVSFEIDMPEYYNSGTLVEYPDINKGLYFLFIRDGITGGIYWMKTFRKN